MHRRIKCTFAFACNKSPFSAQTHQAQTPATTKTDQKANLAPHLSFSHEQLKFRLQRSEMHSRPVAASRHLKCRNMSPGLCDFRVNFNDACQSPYRRLESGTMIPLPRSLIRLAPFPWFARGYFTLRGPLSDSATFFLEKLSILPVKFYKWEIRFACLSKAYTNH